MGLNDVCGKRLLIVLWERVLLCEIKGDLNREEATEKARKRGEISGVPTEEGPLSAASDPLFNLRQRNSTLKSHSRMPSATFRG